MVSSGIAGSILSVMMSIIMIFNSMPLGSMINNAVQLDKDQLAQERIQLMGDYFDALMQIEYEKPFYVADEEMYENKEEIPEGVEYVEIDFSSIDNFLAFVEKVSEDETVLGGDFTKIDFSALEGDVYGDRPAIELLYDVIEFLDDNSELVAKVLTAEFDYGRLGRVLPKIFGKNGQLNTFDLYEVIMDMFGVYYDSNSGRYTSLRANENGTLILAYSNGSHKVGECSTPGDNTFHGDYTWTSGGYWTSEYNPETGLWEEVYIEEYENIHCYTALTAEEKAQYSAQNYLVEVFQDCIRNMLVGLGASESRADAVASNIDVANGGMYAMIPQIVEELANIGSKQMGDTFVHLIRDFFARAYGVKGYKTDYAPGDVRLTGVTSDNAAYMPLYNYYFGHFTDGDYALFDYDLTVNGIDFKMFEASYTEEGTLIFYPYEETISGKEAGNVVDSVFEMYFAVPSNYVPNTSVVGESITDEKTGDKYFVDEDGNVFNLSKSIFPVEEDVPADVIASLTDMNLVAKDDIYLYVDGVIEKTNIDKMYVKDGYVYTVSTDEKGNKLWKRWALEADTTFYKNLNESLAAICELVDPYYVYNSAQYDFVENAKQVGNGYLDQVNNVLATIIENSWTEKGLAELNWIAGGNEHLNENIMKFIRTVTGKFFTEEMTNELCNFATIFKELGAEETAANFENFNHFFDAEYYQNADLEQIILDLLLTMDCADGKIEFSEDFELPKNIDSIEAYVACLITFTTDSLFPYMNASSKYIKNGALVEKTEEEWKEVVLNEGLELLLRICAEEAGSSAIIFTSDEIDNYKLKGWEYMDFLDEIVDRLYVYLEGFVAVCDDLECEFGVLDGNGPWYKISRILNALLPTALYSGCEKTYGDETLVFDIGVLIEDALLGNMFDLDLSGLFNIVTSNENDFNPFVRNNYIKAVLICLQNFVNAVLPGSIADEDIVSPDHLINKETLAGITKRLLKALNERKREIVPVIVSWFDLLGAFEGISKIDVETKYSYFVYEDEDGKYAYIDYYYGDVDELGDDIYVPSEINGLPVRGYSIGEYKFQDHKVHLPDTLKYFDTAVESYYYINYAVGENNPYLEVVDGVLYDEDMTMILRYPRNKTDEIYEVPGTVKNIYARDFENNGYLKTLKINEGTQGIYRSRNENDSWGTFSYNITDIYIPSSVENIDPNAFNTSTYNHYTIHGPINSYAYKVYNEVLKNNRNCSFEYYIPSELFVTVNTEKQAVKSNIYIYGYSLPGATVKVYDGDVLIGKDNNISVDKYSKWEANVHLNNPNDSGSYHTITVVAEKDGATVTSKPITVYYEKGAVVFKEFKMLHNDYYSVTITDETINYRHSMTWIPSTATSDIRVRLINSNKLVALYLVSDGYKVPMTRGEKDYWIANNCDLGNPPDIIRLEGVIKNKGKLETIQIGGDIRIHFLIDPSGNVYEFNDNHPLEGVTTTVQYWDNETSEWVTWDAEYYDQVNPIITDVSGGFKWVVPKGEWRVVCEKDGYETYTSYSYSIPPEVTGLKYFMNTTKAPEVKKCYYEDGVITIVYDQFITSDLNSYNYQVDGATYVTVTNADGEFKGISSELWSYGNVYGYKTVKLYCSDENGNSLTTTPESVTINGIYNYAGKCIENNTVVVPEDHTKYYAFDVSADKEEIVVGDVVTVTLTTEEAIEDAVDVTVSNSAVFDSELVTYNESGDIASTENVEIPESITFDENGQATFKFVAGFEGYSVITLKVGGTTETYDVNINAKAEQPEHTHDYGELEIVESTCLSAGYECGQCECGDYYYVEYDFADHKPAEKVTEKALRKAATCRARATYYYTCDICDEVLKDGEVLEEGNISNADYFAYGKTADHDLAENGGCKNCSYVEPKEEIICQHKNKTTTNTQPTCEESGVEGLVICDDCGETIVDGTFLPALIHYSTLKVTDNEDGTHTINCCNSNADGWTCDEAKIQKCADSKIFVETVAPKCEVSGYTTYMCNVCKSVWDESDDNALEHNIIIDSYRAPTCTAPGLEEGQHCSRCDGATVEQIEIPVADHNIIIDEYKAPTCTATGLEAGQHCETCDTMTVEQKVIPKLEHDIIFDAAVKATCTQTGKTAGQHCSSCNEATIAQKVVAKKPHTEKVINAKEATETEEGYTGDTVCEVCGNTVKKGSKIPAIGACKHMCHKNNFIWKILRFFFKLFKLNPVCECGVAHY